MKTERIVISFIAAIIGILVAGVAFYFYQSTKTLSPAKSKSVSITAPTPTPVSSIFLAVENPKDEQVFDTKTITINGKTTPEATIIITTDLGDQVISPSQIGAFSTTVTLDSDQNKIEIIAIAPNGEETRVIKTVTFSTETF